MTISTTTSRAEYAGNGVTTVFAFPYPFFADADLTVLLLRSTGIVDTLVLNTDYTVSGEGTPNSGQVTLMVAPAVGESLFILRELDLTQETDYISGDPFPAESHERALDRLTLIAQQIQEQIDRSVTLNPTSSGVTTELPVPEANALIGWNTAADALQNYTGTSSALVSVAMEPVVAAATLADARSELGASVVGDAVFTAATAQAARNSIGLGAGADIASAATVNLTARTGNIVDISGTVKTTDVTLEIGGRVLTVALAAWPINVSGVLVYTCAAGDMVEWSKDAAGTLSAVVWKKGQVPAFFESPFNLSASVGSNALTVTLKKGGWFFRNPTLGTGEFEYVKTDSDLTLTISSGSTLGTTSAVQSDVLVRVVNDAGTLRLTAENMAGGMDASETGVISTTAEGGAGGADSSTVIYSGTAVTSKAYRVAGIVRSTQATAGTWATAPSLVQGAGGQAVTAMSSFGYGQTWQDVTASRSLGTTYYNTTGKTIFVEIILDIAVSTTASGIVNGFTKWQHFAQSAGTRGTIVLLVPAGGSYSANTGTVVSNGWNEYR